MALHMESEEEEPLLSKQLELWEALHWWRIWQAQVWEKRPDAG